ncbi:MAG: hypothetical protein ABIP90_05475 [Vicinamibacterales bacterium]
MSTQRTEQAVFWFIPAVTLLVTFVGLCVMTGSAWPWNHVVHEDGRHTLLATVFYVEHASRELLPDALLALGVAGAVRHYFPPQFALGVAAASRPRRRLGLITTATFSLIIGATVWTEGGQVLVDNLSQLHTRSGAPLIWGAHWRYHLIERFAQIMLAFSVTGAVWMIRSKPAANGGSGRLGFYGAALLLFAALTIVFRPTTEPFNDPAFLGHQLRELFTHSFVTLPLALGTCLSLARRYSPSTPLPREAGPGTLHSSWPIILTGAVAILSGAFLLTASVLSDAQSHGQTAGLAALLFPHFAEHALGYVFVPALAGLLYLAPTKT